MQEVIEVAKTVRDLELKYAEVDVAGTKRLHRYDYTVLLVYHFKIVFFVYKTH